MEQNTVSAEVSSRLHFLKILKHNSLNSDDISYFYTTVIGPIVKYASPAWHNILTNEQSCQTESVQKCALSIISYSQCICQRAKTARLQNSFLMYALNNYQT